MLDAFLSAYRAQPALLTTPYPGVRESLARLSARGMKLGVATNKPADLAQAIADALELQPLRGAVVGSDPGLALKPEPDLVSGTLEKLDVSASEAVLVGDIAADVRAARSAGLPVIVVS